MNKEAQSSITEQAWDRVLRPWWSKILVGMMLLIFSVGIYYDLRAVESKSTERPHFGRGTEILHNIGGIWLPVGLTAALGFTFVAWGAVHLNRTIHSTPLRTAYATAMSDASPATNANMPAGRAIYWAFYKVILGVWTTVHLLVVIGAVKLAYVHPTPEGLGFAALLTAVLAYFDLELIARWFGWDEGPLLDFTERATWIVVGGFTIAVVLSGVAAAASSGRYERQLEADRRAVADRQQTIDRQNTPEMKAANAFLRRRDQIKREAAAGGKVLSERDIALQYAREQKAKKTATTATTK